MHNDLAPIIFFLVVGIVTVSYIYFRSKEKQMMIEKGLSYEQMVELLRTKRDPYLMLKLGIIVLFFALGLGIGFLFQEWTKYQVTYGTGENQWTDYHTHDQWMAFWIIFMTGLGFVTSFLVTRKLKNGSN